MSFTAAGLPSWIMMDRFVFCRDDDDDGSFPDDDAAPMRANSFTSLGDPFTVALLPAAPPAVSRLYERWPPEHACTGTDLITAHRGLLVFRTTSRTTGVAGMPYKQDYFVFKAATAAGVSSLIKRLPECTEPIVLRSVKGGVITMERLFHQDTVGLVFGGRGGGDDDEEFAVVQLAKFVDIPGSSHKMGAELCVFRSRLSSSSESNDDVAEGSWEILTLPIRHSEEEFSDLQGWSTDGAVTLNDSICWFDYHHGGIMSYTPPSLAAAAGGGESFITYVRLPIDNRPNNSLPSNYPLEMYRSLCVTGQRGNEQLKFVDVARSDRNFFGPLLDSSSFTLTCYTFTKTDDPMWRKDAVITSGDLWDLDSGKRLMPRNSVTTFPLVSRDEPHIVHFLMSEQRHKIDKVSVVVIDIITKAVVSVSPYIQGDEDLLGKDADMVDFRRRLPWSFLSTRF